MPRRRLLFGDTFSGTWLGPLHFLIRRWLGWTRHAGLDGGCAIAAGLFELDDQTGPVRDTLFAMEKFWRDLLLQMTARAVSLRELRSDLGYGPVRLGALRHHLSHHVSLRFVRDPEAGARAETAVEVLVQRALPAANHAQAKGRVTRWRHLLRCGPVRERMPRLRSTRSPMVRHLSTCIFASHSRGAKS